MSKEEKEQFLVLQNLFHDCDIKCRRLEEENERLKKEEEALRISHNNLNKRRVELANKLEDCQSGE